MDSGTASSQAIGGAGGSLQSSDAKLTLTVPPGALGSTVTLNVQPITNLAHGGLGQAYRIEPAGTVFSSPVTLTFAVSDDDLKRIDGTGMGVAYQDADGYWRWVDGATYDANARTVSAPITHLSSWSLVAGVQILPLSATVGEGESLQVQIVQCYGDDKDDSGLPLVPLEPDPLASLVGFSCGGSDPLAPLVGASGWSVNGVAGGNSTYGTITPSASDGHAATYTAPSTRPSPDTVAVQVHLPSQTWDTWLYSHVKIEQTAGGNSYSCTTTKFLYGQPVGPAVCWEWISPSFNSVDVAALRGGCAGAFAETSCSSTTRLGQCSWDCPSGANTGLLGCDYASVNGASTPYTRITTFYSAGDYTTEAAQSFCANMQGIWTTG